MKMFMFLLVVSLITRLVINGAVYVVIVAFLLNDFVHVVDVLVVSAVLIDIIVAALIAALICFCFSHFPHQC